MDPKDSYRLRNAWRLILPPLLGVTVALGVAQQYRLSPVVLVPIGLLLGATVAHQFWKYWGQIPSMQPGEYTARRGAWKASAAIVLGFAILGLAVSSVFDLPESWGAIGGGVAGVALAIPFWRIINREIDREYGIQRKR